MSAVAGVVDFTTDIANLAECREALLAQQLYGSRLSIDALAGAAFGLLSHSNHAKIVVQNDILVVGDCTLHNRRDLASSLGVADGKGDVELVLLAWRRWNRYCFERMFGDYSIAIYLRDEQAIVLARSPGGRRPLFYKRGNPFRFASMPSGVIGPGPVAYDPNSLHARLRGSTPAGEASYFADILRILPGSAVRFSRHGESQLYMWAPQLEPIRGQSEAKLVDEFRVLLGEAVSARIPRTGLLATHLSSGYDSNAVAATLSKLAPERTIAFTAVPNTKQHWLVPIDRQGDEGALAARAARYYGLRHEVVPDVTSLVTSLRGHGRFNQEPAGNTFNIGWWTSIAERSASLGASTVLTGEMGNFTISAGGLPALRDWFTQYGPLEWFRESRAAVGRSDVRWRGVLYASTRGPYATGRYHALRNNDPGGSLLGTRARFGIDEEDPTADRRLAEFLLRLPPEQLLAHGVYKPLARKALADRVLPDILAVRTRGYQGAGWLARLNPAEVNDALDEIEASGSAAGVVNIARLRSLVEPWPTCPQGSIDSVIDWGRALTNGLAVGLFVVETEKGLSRERIPRSDRI